MVKKGTAYTPFYPTTVGTTSHDVTLQQLPAYSMRQKTELKTKCYSPGPGAYPKDDDAKKRVRIPKSIYPEDKAFKYSMGVKGKEPMKSQIPSPATYPSEKDRNGTAKKEVISIYPKDNANQFSIGRRREQKYSTPTPGPAIYPRDTDTTNNINCLLPIPKANKFTMPARRNVKDATWSPGPAQYPCVGEEVKNKVMTIYPADTKLLPTIKARYDIKNKQQVPASNTYPMLGDSTKKSKVDFTQKMIAGRRSPQYSMGVKHSPKQHILILNEDGL